MLRKCLKCGKEYEGVPGSTLCRQCAEESKKSVLRQRICTVCGRSFVGGPRAIYCPDCREIKKRESTSLYHKRKRQGESRKLGDTDKCEVCGKEYTISGSRQRYCKECAAEAIAAIDREQALKWLKDNKDNEKRHRDRKDATATMKCVICGNPFIPGIGGNVTCSSECAKKYRKQQNAEYQNRHRIELNNRHKERNNQKIKLMTPEELALYRQKVNEKARENYKKRKEKEAKKTV